VSAAVDPNPASGGKPADRALWITWYDLAAGAAREEYLAWLHGSYIPAQLGRAGFLWAAHYESEDRIEYAGAKGRLRNVNDGSVPGGTRFILIFGGAAPNAFLDPAPSEVHERLPAADRALLDLRTGERVNVMVEQARVAGPEAASRDPAFALSPCIQLGSFNPGPGARDEENLVAWFAQSRLPSMTRMPGSVGTRKLVSVCGWAKHAILYEFVSVAARNDIFVRHEEHSDPEAARWSDRIVRTVLHAPGSPSVVHRIWSAVRDA